MTVREGLARYKIRALKWARYATGRSYQHMPQGIGRAYMPGELRGYFNDLTAKADWRGRSDADGIPVVATDRDPNFHFPIMIFQWGLAHWDLWELSGRQASEHLSAVERAVEWALRNITSEGGWHCWTGLRRPVNSTYSAMAQGQALSLLSRYHRVTDRDDVAAATDAAFLLLCATEPHGLLSRKWGVVSLEEYPGDRFTTVLNGWIFALMGAHDHALRTEAVETAATVSDWAEDLSNSLYRFDLGYWSLYNLAGDLASPFYHELHIAQLKALAITFEPQAARFIEFMNIFDRYRRQPLRRSKAFAIKVFQKLTHVGIGEMS